MFLKKNKKVSDMSYLHFIEKAQQNLSMHACAMAIFVHVHVKKCVKKLCHKKIKWPSKQKLVSDCCGGQRPPLGAQRAPKAICRS